MNQNSLQNVSNTSMVFYGNVFNQEDTFCNVTLHHLLDEEVISVQYVVLSNQRPDTFLLQDAVLKPDAGTSEYNYFGKYT